MSAASSEVSVLIPFYDENRDKAEVLRKCPDVQVKDIIFNNISDKETLGEYVQRMKQVVRDNDINIILPSVDLSTFVHAAIARDFPHIPGPSLESCFLAFHKAYTRQYLDPTEDPTPYDIVDLDSPTMSQDAARALEKVGLPAFVKPATGTATFGVKKVESLDEMKLALKNLRRVRREHPDFKYLPSAAFFRDYFEQYLDVQKYPLAFRDVVIVEPYLDAETNHTVDGCVVSKRIVHWAITGQQRWDDQEAKFTAVTSPVSDPEDVQRRMWEIYDAVAERMVQFGFDNGFLNIEIFRMKDGQMSLVEVNARGSTQLQRCYSVSHENAVQDYVYLSAGRGAQPIPPTLTGRHALAYLVKFRDIEKPGNLMDFDQLEKLKSDPDVSIMLTAGPDDDVANITGSAGCYFAWLWTYGSSADAALRKLAEVLRLTVKKPEQLTYPIDHMILVSTTEEATSAKLNSVS